MKTIPLLLVVTMLLAACESMPPLVTTAACQSSSNLTINVKSTNPRATPENFCAKPGSTFDIRIRPTGQQTNTVQIIAKTNNPDGGGPMNWLTKVNSVDGDEIEVTVPGNAYFEELCDVSGDDCQFRYAIFVNGKNPVDPRVTVKE